MQPPNIMAVKKTAARPRAAKTQRTRSTPQSPSPMRRALPVLLRAARFARPRTASELLALAFVLLAISACGIQVYAVALRGYHPGAELVGPLALLMAALAARLYPLWRAEIQTMTVDRARNYSGSFLILFVALSITGHFVTSGLGLGTG